MRHDAAAGRRSRNRNGSNNGYNHNQGGQRRTGFSGNSGSGNRNQVFDSNGPEVRIRGTANQICEKYQALAKDAASADNRVLAESYLQHAEHYQRMINQWAEENPVQPDRIVQSSQPQQQPQPVETRPAVTVTATAAQTEDDLGLPSSLLAPLPRTELADA